MSKICSPVSTDLFVCIVHCEPFPPPPSQQYTLSWELRKFSLQNIPSAGKIRSDTAVQWIRAGIVWVRSRVQSYYCTSCIFFLLVIHFVKKDVAGITRHVVTTISTFSFTMLLLDRILTHIVNHLSNTSYHLQYLYCQGGYVFGAKPNLITCVGYIFLSVPHCTI